MPNNLEHLGNAAEPQTGVKEPPGSYAEASHSATELIVYFLPTDLSQCFSIFYSISNTACELKELPFFMKMVKICFTGLKNVVKLRCEDMHKNCTLLKIHILISGKKRKSLNILKC